MVWSSVRKAGGGGGFRRPPSHGYGEGGIADLDETEHRKYCSAGSLQRFWTRFRGFVVTSFASHTVTWLFPLVTGQSLLRVERNLSLNHILTFNNLLFLNTPRLSMHSAAARVPHISPPNVLASQLEMNTQSGKTMT